MRNKMQAGYGRKLVTSVAFAAAWYAVFACWSGLESEEIKKLLESAQKVAFVAAAFSVTAYNLRTRVVDLVLKIEGEPKRVNAICTVARSCGQRLTNIVMLFTITAVMMGCLGFFSETSKITKYFAGATAGLFAGSCVQIVYVLFAFERLERFILDDAEEKAQKKEADRLFPKSSEEKTA